MQRLFALLLILGLLSGCPSLPIPDIQIKPGSKADYLVEGGEHPHHAHQGVTVFGNFSKSYPFEWDLRERTKAIVSGELATQGLAPVALRDHGFTFGQLDKLVIAKMTSGPSDPIAPACANDSRHWASTL